MRRRAPSPRDGVAPGSGPTTRPSIAGRTAGNARRCRRRRSRRAPRRSGRAAPRRRRNGRRGRASCGIATPPSQTSSPGAEGVDVEARADPDVADGQRGLASMRLRRRRNRPAVVSLMLPASPANERTGMPAHSATAASSVKSAPPSRPPSRARARMRARSGIPAASAPPARPSRGDGGGDHAVGVDRFRVSVTGSAGMPGVGVAERPMTRPIRSARDERPRRIMDQHDARAVRAASASRPARTDSCRVAAAGDRRQQASSMPAAQHRRSDDRRVRSRRLNAVDRGMRQEGVERPPEHGFPPIVRYCLGKSPPARTPRPAATIKATVSGIGGHPFADFSFAVCLL